MAHVHHHHQHRHVSDIVKLVHRVAAPLAESAAAINDMGHNINIAVPNRVLEARADSTTSPKPTGSCGVNPCEYPTSYTLPIILGVVIPVVGASICFLILHRRHVRKQREEDANDRHASLDFGLGNVPKSGRRNLPKSNMHMQEGDEKDSRSRRQLSMDMDMTSPYLLPPELQNSRESIHSLSRSMHNKEDPYRPVSQYIPGDNRSTRSHDKQGSSIYTSSSSRAPSRLHDLGSPDAGLLSNAEPMPRSNPPMAFAPPPRQNSLAKDQLSSGFDKNSSPPYPLPSQPTAAHIVDPVSTAKLSSLDRPNALGLAPQQQSDSQRESYAGDTAGLRHSNNYLGAFIHERDLDLSMAAPPTSSPPAFELPAEPYKTSSPPPNPINGLPSNPRPPRKESMPAVQPQAATYVDDNESDYGNQFEITPPSPARDTHAQSQSHRYSMDVPPEEYVQAGLGAPGFDAKRLSMGFRPLPPDAATEHDDPEVRANRIRSFYKEYFDETKPAPAGHYYEDYDVNYLDQQSQRHMYQQQGQYDPNSNAFVMPYAEPVTRRAMTPPPDGMRQPPRFQGGPRPRNGSFGAMSTMSGGGRRGPQMYPPGPYPQGPKAFSTTSGRMGPPKKHLPPPSPLNTLPTPSKLKDDSFALMNSLEFAPPSSYRERVQGRSESPLGERRPYSPAVPAFAPIASSYDELAAIPSPHMLRKSGTFTSLDFAPPKKFRDPDTMSDAGSIRSNRSGVSVAQTHAIRNGAYRVSKIPQDVVFTKDDLATTLKPQWGMRQGS